MGSSIAITKIIMITVDAVFLEFLLVKSNIFCNLFLFCSFRAADTAGEKPPRMLFIITENNLFCNTAGHISTANHVNESVRLVPGEPFHVPLPFYGMLRKQP